MKRHKSLYQMVEELNRKVDVLNKRDVAVHKKLDKMRRKRR